MDDTRAWALLESARVGVLSTIRSDGIPRIVPVVFAMTPERQLVTAVDHKPKSTRSLHRLADISRDPRVTVLCHSYEDDWSRLWWVRVDGSAVVDDAPDLGVRAALIGKYHQYADHPPAGPWIVITPAGVTGWAANG